MPANLFRPGAGRWIPDADAFTAPEGTLLRADNLVEDALGTLSKRAGSSLIFSGLQEQVVHSLYTVELANGTTYRFMGVDSRLYINGIAAGSAFAGSGDIAMGDDSYQAFFARGNTKKAYDGTTLRDWGIPKPIAAPTLQAVNAITATVAAFNNVESPQVTATEGTMAFAPDDAAVANEAIQVTPDSTTSRGCLQRLFTSDQDFFDIAGSDGTDNDQFDLLLNMAEPRNVEKIIVQFGVGNSSTIPFDKDRYEFTLDIKNGEVPQIKDISSAGYAAYESSVLALLEALDPTIDVGAIRTPEQVKTTMAEIGSQPSPKSGGRPDPSTWSHLTVTRGSFTRIGSTPGRDWNTVRGFRVTYVTRAGTTSVATFSDGIWSGGGNRSLTGKFRACYRAGRNAGKYIELSPPSDSSAALSLNHQSLQVTVPAAVLSALQGYADQLWIYLFGGLNLNTWYRFAITAATAQTGMTIDELTNPAGSNFNTASERTRLTSHGFSITATPSGTQDLRVVIHKSEEQALSEGVRMEPYQIVVPNNIIGIAGPWANRMFALDEDGSVWPSSNISPSSFNSRQRLDLTRFGDPLWIARTSGGIYVGMEKDIIFLEGTGDDSDDLTFIDLSPRPSNVGNPPVDRCFVVEGNTIIYRSADGPMTFNGASVTPLPFGGTELLWRKQGPRHGVEHLNVDSGRFRVAVDNGIMYLLAPEGVDTSTNVIYRLKGGNWRRLVYSQVTAFHSLLTEPDGTLIAGDSQGRLWKLEDGTQDNAQAISVVFRTPFEGNPLSYSDAMDLQLQTDTGAVTGTAAVHLDGSEVAAASFSFAATAFNSYRIQARAIGKFLRAQLRITGNFSTFRLGAWNLTYVPRAQHYVLFDSGWFGASGDILWMSEAEVDCDSPSNLLLDLYLDDRLHASGLTIPVLPNRRSVYRVPLPRGSKSRRPRIVLRTSAANGVGPIGFDLFLLRVFPARGSGNEARQPLIVFQAGA